jgi:predicted nucleic acid-binding protein
MTHKGVFCDTSFFIRLLDKSDSLHDNAKAYFKYFTENDFELYISTIAIAEYCVGGEIHELPLRNLQIVPFNFDHATKTGEFARIVFRNKNKLKLKERNLIPNDTKLFAQADCKKSVELYLSSDTESRKIYDLIKQETSPKFQFVDLHTPYNIIFGLIDL